MKTDKQKISFLNPGEINDTTNKTGPFKQKKTNCFKCYLYIDIIKKAHKRMHNLFCRK